VFIRRAQADDRRAEARLHSAKRQRQFARRLTVRATTVVDEIENLTQLHRQRVQEAMKTDAVDIRLGMIAALDLMYEIVQRPVFA
jgi:hypothetical protein